VRSERLGLPAALLLSAAALLSYANGLTGAFVYDDKAIVRDNFRLRRPDGVVDIFTTQYFGGPRGTGTAYRPVLLLSFAAQWWIHGGDVVPYHAVNLLLHVGVTLVLAKLLLRIGLAPPVALGAALLFAVLPMHVEAVTGIVGRGETLAAALVLGSLALALDASEARGRRAWRIAVALLLYALANLTKESASVAPALLFLILAFRAEGGLAGRLGAALRRGAAYALGCAAVLGAVFLLRSAVLGGALHAPGTGIFEVENALAPLPPLRRAANAALLFFRYLGRMALPARLSADESAWSIRPLGPRDVLFWAAPVLLSALIVAAVLRLKERRASAFGFLFLAVAVLPASNLLFPTGTIFAERLAYLPSAGFCVIAAAAITGGAAEIAALSNGRRLLLAAVALAYAGRCVVRNPVWQSDQALFTNLVAVSPGSAKAHYDFAYMSADLGRMRQTLEHDTRAVEIYPGYWDAWAGKGRAERELGRIADSEASYTQALRILPTYENGFYGLGLAREDRGDRAGAARAYRDGLRHNPQSLPLAYRAARLLAAEGNPAALHAWRRTLAIEPGSLPSRLGYAEWLLASGRRDEALSQLRETIRRGPRYAPARQRLLEVEGGEPPSTGDRAGQ
jgi:protein O-mannosyl-transferase